MKEFYLKMLKIYLSNALLWNGFDSCQEEVLNVFTEVIAAYIKRLGRDCKNIAILAGKTDVSIFDVLLCLNNYNLKFGSEISEYISIDRKNMGSKRFGFLQEIMEIDDEQKDKINENSKRSETNINEKQLIKKIKKTNVKIKSEIDNKLGNEYPDFYPSFPNDFLFKETISNERKLYDEAEVKKIKAIQRRDFSTEISYLVENKLENVEKKDDENNSEFNPFNIPLKKIKTINLKDF